MSVCYPDAKLLVGEIPKPLRSELRSGCAFQEMLLEKTGKTRIFMGHLLPLLPISLSVHHIRYGFSPQVIGAFQMCGLFQNVDLRHKFLLGQLVIVNSQRGQEDAGLSLFLRPLVVHGGFQLLVDVHGG